MTRCVEIGRTRGRSNFVCFDALFTAAELAELFGRTTRAVQKWRDKGYLTPVDYRGRENLYDYREAVRVEREVRARTCRAKGAGP